jgi:hypothetical protein
MVTDLPVQIRVAIDLVAAADGGLSGSIRACVVGDSRLVEELARYAPILDSPHRVIALGAAPGELRIVLARERPEYVTTVVEGLLARPVRPLRVNAFDLAADLPLSEWRTLGYERVASSGVEGAGAIGWAAGERLMRRWHRPALADRCRIAMLRTQVVAATSGPLATVLVRAYRQRP